MKDRAEFYRRTVEVIGIGILVAGGPRTGRSDGGRDFADKFNFTKIDVPGSAGYTVPYGINPQGDIVGLYFDGGGLTHGFLLRKEKRLVYDRQLGTVWGRIVPSTGAR